MLCFLFLFIEFVFDFFGLCFEDEGSRVVFAVDLLTVVYAFIYSFVRAFSGHQLCLGFSLLVII